MRIVLHQLSLERDSPYTNFQILKDYLISYNPTKSLISIHKRTISVTVGPCNTLNNARATPLQIPAKISSSVLEYVSRNTEGISSAVLLHSGGGSSTLYRVDVASYLLSSSSSEHLFYKDESFDFLSFFIGNKAVIYVVLFAVLGYLFFSSKVKSEKKRKLREEIGIEYPLQPRNAERLEQEFGSKIEGLEKRLSSLTEGIGGFKDLEGLKKSISSLSKQVGGIENLNELTRDLRD